MKKINKNISILYIFFSIYFICQSICLSQETINFEYYIRKLNSNNQNDTVKPNIYSELSRLSSNKDTAIYYAKLGLELSNRLNYIHGQILNLNAISNAYFDRGMVADAFSYLNKALLLADNSNDLFGKELTHRNYARTCLEIGDYNQAAINLEIAMKLIEKFDNNVEKASILYTTGQYYLKTRDLDKAIEYFQKSKETWVKTGEIKLSGLISSIGNVYFQKQDFKKALEYYFEIINTQKKLMLIYDYGYVYNNIGMCYTRLGNKKLAFTYLDMSLAMRVSAGTQIGIVNTYNNMADAHYKFGEYDKAIEYASKSLNISLSNNIKDQAFDALETLVNSYITKQDYKKAFTYLSLRNNFKDSLLNEEKVKYIADANARLINQKNLEENKALKDRQELDFRLINTQRIVVIVVIFFMAIISFLGYRQYSSNRKIKEINHSLVLKNEEISIQKTQLEEINKLKDRLYAIAAHDTRTPLSSLYSVVTLYNEGAIKEEDISEYFKKIAQTLESTWHFLDNFLFWIKSQMAGVSIVSKRTNLVDLVEEVMLVVQNSADNKGIKLINEYSNKEFVNVDENMVMIVIRNLISNAIKFTESGGFVKINNIIKDNSLIISIEDSGIGIKDLHINGIFEFKQTFSKGTAGEQGSGLGLILCKDFIEKNGGTIWAESEIGKGSKFSFSLPIEK